MYCHAFPYPVRILKNKLFIFVGNYVIFLFVEYSRDYKDIPGVVEQAMVFLHNALAN